MSETHGGQYVSVVLLDVVHVVVKVRDIKGNSTYLYDLHGSWRCVCCCS